MGSAASLLFAQHDLLPRIGDRERVPVAVIEGTVADAVAPGRSVGFTSLPDAAMIMGVVLRPALFTFRPLSPRAPSLARVAIAAVRASG